MDEACFIDASGQEIARVTYGEIAPLADLSSEEASSPFFAPTMQLAERQVHQNTPYVSPDSGRWVVSNSTPIFLAGKPVALLHFETNIEALRQRLVASLQAGTSARIVDITTGKLIFDTAQNREVTKEDFPAATAVPQPSGRIIAAFDVTQEPGNDNRWQVQ